MAMDQLQLLHVDFTSLFKPDTPLLNMAMAQEGGRIGGGWTVCVIERDWDQANLFPAALAACAGS